MGDLEGKVNKCVSKNLSKLDISNGIRSAHSLSRNFSPKESGSGFMLLSVKHLSKVKKNKHLVTSLNDNMFDGKCAAISDTSFSNSCHDALMPQTTMCDDASHDIYGSGSIEAEEFEDFDDQEDDTDINEDVNGIQDMSTLSQRCLNTHSCSVIPLSVEPTCVNSVCQLHSSTNHQSFINPLNGHFKPRDSFNEVPGKMFGSMYLDDFQHNHPNQCLSPITIPGFEHSKNAEYPPPFQSECIYTAYSRDPCNEVFINPTKSDIIYLGSPIHHFDYCSSSEQNRNITYHLHGRKIVPDSQDFRITSDASYSKSVCNMANNYSDPPNTSSWMNLNVLHPTYRIGLSPHSRHGSYTQPPITCLHHLHPQTTSDNTAPIVSVNNHLASEVVAIAAASLPPLQPASRFRKARIHETVEQWSYGRFSVHDCHLKTVPDWVNELQKKSFVYEKAVATLANRRIKCMSCFIPKGTQDKESALFPQSTFDSAHVGVTVDSPSEHSHKKVDVLENELADRSFVLSNGFSGANLFYFWNDGLRIHSQVPFATIHTRSSEPTYDSCGKCDNTLQNVESKYDDKSMCTINDYNENSNVSDLLSLRENDIQRNDTELSNNTTDAIYAPDPATAYLRRQNMGTTNYLNKLTMVTGSEPSCNNPGVIPTQNASDIDTSLKLDSTHIDSNKVFNRTFDEAGNFHMDAIYSHKASGALSNNAPPVSPNTSFLANRPNQIPLKLQISSEISKSRLRLLDLLPNDNSNLGPDCTSIMSFGPSVQRLINTESAKLINKCESEYNFSRSNISSDNFPVRTSKNNGSRLQSGYRRSKSFDNSSYVCHLDRIRSSRLYNSDIFKRTCAPLTVDNVTSSVSPKGLKFPGDFSEEVGYCQNSRESSLLSDRLEARIRASMEAIRSTLVNSFRDELATVLAENVNLRSEITRLNSELTLLRSYQHAFFAVRPFVPSGIWENICVQQGLPISPFVNDSDYQSPFNPQISR
ncbi:hypothetical protein MN116_003761 [Schistosoma mekongi]|uniref:Uncharacterized protein n=1 Tax=Schistosoma mekongi TaxID=38744 RepID=A0AAE1ZEF7_SCHME|nr:hypothetical protein MN116_003761 [Schistosoma mekongi]